MATDARNTGVPSRAPSLPAPNRRRFVGALALAPVAALPVPMLFKAPSAFRIAEAEYYAALNRFNALPPDLETTNPDAHAREERRFLDAVGAVDDVPVADWSEFADAFEIACDGGKLLPNEDLVMKLLGDARRLSGRA